MINPEEKLLQLFIQNKGYLLSKALNRNSMLYLELKKLVSSSVVEKIKPGLYKHLELAAMDEWEELALLYPEGVFCLYSAWDYYELSTITPNKQYMVFEYKTKVKILDYPPIQAFFWADKLYRLEIEDKGNFKIYSLEKSVCDAIKFRNKIGKNTMAEILRNYLKKKNKNLDKLLKIAKMMKMENVLRDYINILI
jgi:hypothetical protein